MSKRSILVATLALSTAFATGAFAQAPRGQEQTPMQGHSPMQGGGMPHPSGDMQAMMDRCNRMMQQPATNSTAQQQQERRDCEAMMRMHGMSGSSHSGGNPSGDGQSGTQPRR